MESQLSQQQPPCQTTLLFVPSLSKRMASGHQSTVYEQRLKSSPTEGAPVAEGEPEEANGIGDPRKTTETETRLPSATAYACTVWRPSIPGKI